MSVNHSTNAKEFSTDDSLREKMDISKLAICWALTLTTSTLLTVSVSSLPPSINLCLVACLSLVSLLRAKFQTNSHL